MVACLQPKKALASHGFVKVYYIVQQASPHCLDRMFRSVFLYDIVRLTLLPKYRETPLLHISFSPEIFQTYHRTKILNGDLRQIEKINLAHITLSSEFQKPVVVLLKKEKMVVVI